MFCKKVKAVHGTTESAVVADCINRLHYSR